MTGSPKTAVCAASRVYLRRVRAVAARRRCCWSARAAPRSRRAPRACRRRLPHCLAPQGSHPPGTHDTRGWNTGTHGKIRTGQVQLPPQHLAVLRRLTTQCANCRQYPPRRPSRRQSRVNLSSDRVTPACLHPRSWRYTRRPDADLLNPLRIIIKELTTTAFSFNLQL